MTQNTHKYSPQKYTAIQYFLYIKLCLLSGMNYQTNLYLNENCKELMLNSDIRSNLGRNYSVESISPQLH